MTIQQDMKNIIPGIFFVFPLALFAWLLGRLMPLVGGPVFGILLGMMLAVWKRPAIFQSGIAFTAKKILQGSIILLGFEMNLTHVLKVGSQSLSIMLFTLSAAAITAWVIGRYLKLSHTMSILIGVGTAICGGSAIAATAPVIAASDQDVAHSISTIFLFNIAAVFIFPFTGHLIGMSDIGFGMWAGTAINDTSSVVAAGYSYSQAAGSFATIVKLTRTLMIIPVTILLALWVSGKKTQQPCFNFLTIFPWFVLGFLAASLMNTSGWIPADVGQGLAQTGKFLIIMAMTAIGLNTRIQTLIHNGIKPIVLGLSCWLVIAAVSLAAQYQLALW